MYRHKGFSLINTLFAFSIYITVIVMFVSLISTVNRSKVKLNQYYEDIESEEYELCTDFYDLVEMVLH